MDRGTNTETALSNKVIEREGARTDEDAGLVFSCIKGDLDAFESLVKKYEKKMFNVSYRITGNYEDASEIVQDAFVSAYRNLKNFRGQSRFLTWLTAITINLSKNRLKQLKARNAHEPVSIDDPIQTDDGQVAADPPSNEPTVLDRMEKQDVRRKVQDCIEALEPDFREVIILRDMQDFSYDEIGNMLKVREGTIKSRLFRAREAVKECLKRALGTL
jgi:RNA polymerase sigma-70 factor (ECF subfamily)